MVIGGCSPEFAARWPLLAVRSVTRIFTNALSTNGWNRWVPPGCGVQLVGAVAPVVTADF
jgi:hypothetical protein